MKIDQEQLTFYLPYYVTVKYRLSKYSGYKYGTLTGQILDAVHMYKFFKPILNPISDLTENDLHRFSVEFRIAIKSGAEFDILSYITAREFMWLCKHHFDVFGLIEKGFAIDKNTI